MPVLFTKTTKFLAFLTAENIGAATAIAISLYDPRSDCLEDFSDGIWDVVGGFIGFVEDTFPDGTLWSAANSLNSLNFLWPFDWANGPKDTVAQRLRDIVCTVQGFESRINSVRDDANAFTTAVRSFVSEIQSFDPGDILDDIVDEMVTLLKDASDGLALSISTQTDFFSGGVTAGLDLIQTAHFDPDEIEAVYRFADQEVRARLGETVQFDTDGALGASHTGEVEYLFSGDVGYDYRIEVDVAPVLTFFETKINGSLEIGDQKHDFSEAYALLTTESETGPLRGGEAASQFDDALIELDFELVTLIVENLRAQVTEQLGLETPPDVTLGAGEILLFTLDDIPLGQERFSSITSEFDVTFVEEVGHAYGDAPVVQDATLRYDASGQHAQSAIALPAYDPEGGQLRVEVAEGGDLGTFALTDTHVLFTPRLGLSGDHSVTLEVTDGGHRRALTLTLTENHAPKIADDDAVLEVGTARDIHGSLGFVDADADSISYKLISGLEADFGTVTRLLSSGWYELDLVSDAGGSDWFTVAVSDGVTTTYQNIEVAAVRSSDLDSWVWQTSSGLGNMGDITDGPEVVSINGSATDVDVDVDLDRGVLHVSKDGTVRFGPDGDFAYLGYNEWAYVAFDYALADGVVGRASFRVRGEHDDPVANDDDLVVRPGDERFLPVLANDTDADQNDSLTVVDVTGAEHGTTEIRDGELIYIADPDFIGTEVLTYTISDGNTTANATATVGVFLDAPASFRHWAWETQGDLQEMPQNLRNGLDPDLEIVEVNGSAADVGEIVEKSYGGRLQITADGFVRWSPSGDFDHLSFNEFDTRTFTYKLSDGTIHSGQIQVRGEHSDPIAANDGYLVRPGSETVLTVLDNDSDSDANAVLSITAVSDPTAGSVQIVDDALVYIADASYTGVQTLSYTISDGHTTDSAEVTIEIWREIPATFRHWAWESQGGLQEFGQNLLDGMDPDLQISAVNGRSDWVGVAVSQSYGGVLFVDADGTVQWNPDGDFYHLTSNEFSTHTFSYTLTDGATYQGQVQVRGDHSDPVASDDSRHTGRNQSVTIDVLANDSDPDDGDELTITAVDTNGYGTAEITDAGQILFTPRDGFSGRAILSYTVQDNFTRPDTAEIEVYVHYPSSSTERVWSQWGSGVVARLLSDDGVDGNEVALVDGSPEAVGQWVTTDAGITYRVMLNGQVEMNTAGLDWLAYDDWLYHSLEVHLTGHESPRVLNLQIRGEHGAPEGIDDMAVTGVNQPVSVDVLANDIEVQQGETLTLVSVDAGGFGVAQIVDGQIEYTPAQGFEGLARIAYRVEDGSGHTGFDDATLYVEVGNADITRMGSLGAGSGMTSLGNVLDQLGVPGPVSAVNGTAPGTIVLANGAVVTLGADGQLLVDPNGAFQPLQAGAMAMGYLDIEAGGATHLVSFGVRGSNDSPRALTDFASGTAGGAIYVDVLANDFDYDAGDALELHAFDNPAGDVALDDGVLVFTPSEDFAGVARLQYLVTDTQGASTQGLAVVTVAAAQVAPEVDEVLETVAGADVTLAYDTSATRAQSAIALPVDAFDGDHIVVEIVEGGSVGDFVFTQTHAFFTPRVGLSGNRDVVLAVSDGLQKQLIALTLTENTAPGLTGPGTVHMGLSRESSGQLVVDEKDGVAPFLYVATPMDPAFGSISLDPSGAYSVSLERGAEGWSTVTVAAFDGVSTTLHDISFTAARDPFYGTVQHETFTGTAGDDDIAARGGDDTIIGSAGDDTLDGGAGQDTAIYHGAYADYSVTALGDGSFTVVSTRDADAGTDQLTGIESITFDDGTMGPDGFVPFVTEKLRSDPGTAEPWAHIREVFDASGALTLREVTYDDGRFVRSGFENGVLASYAAENAGPDYDWSRIERGFDAVGQIVSQTGTYTDGRLIETTYVNGLRSASTITDQKDAYDWATRQKLYDESGVLTTFHQTLDDGSAYATTYAGGVRATYVAQDQGDTQPWTQISRSFDAAGRLKVQTQTDDDGQTVTTEFEDGVRISRSATDDADVYDWVSRTTTYDEDGVLLSKSFVLDDGRSLDTGYSAGVRSTFVTKDLEDVFDWDTIERTYDSEGRLSSDIGVFDTGRTVETHYAEGLRTQRVETDHDDHFDWVSRKSVFDNDGTLTSKTVVFNDGRSVATNFADGVRTSMLVEDLADHFDWTQIARTYDSDGVLELQTGTFDDGRTVETHCFNGLVSQKIGTDHDDAYQWASYVDIYNGAGERVARNLTTDDGVEETISYVDAVLL